MKLPPIPEGRNWSPETWQAGLDEAVRRSGLRNTKTWSDFTGFYSVESDFAKSIVAHTITLLDAGIVKPVVNEALQIYADIWDALEAPLEQELILSYPNGTETYSWSQRGLAAVAVIEEALNKAKQSNG